MISEIVATYPVASSLVVGTVCVVGLLGGLNYLSYGFMKNRIVSRRRWDLNICCGKTDGGGVNADVAQHSDLPRFQQVTDIYNLPFADQEFDTVLCSHTIEHVDDPERFLAELRRVGKEVTLVLPPMWDLGAAFNVFEHKHVFLTMSKVHHELPRHVRLPLSAWIHRRFGQTIHA